MITYRPAIFADIPVIATFVDFWLSGRGKRSGVQGAVNDFFVSKGQHAGYITRSTVLLAFDCNTLIGWAVKRPNGSLIHMLIAGPYRGKGIGSTMLRILNPSTVRSKTDQSTGDPTVFYLKHGYQISHTETSISSYRKPARRKSPLNNICVLKKKTS